MSVQSGGVIPAIDPGDDGIALGIPEDPRAKQRREICRKKDFELTFLPAVDMNTVVDAIIASVNPAEGLDSIQQINSKKYIISFKTTVSAEDFLQTTALTFRIPGAKTECRWLGAQHKRIKVAYLPAAVPNETLENVLKNYGTVIQIADEMYTDKPVQIKTGTRIVDILMVHPVPNIITVNGFSVPVMYKGVKIQCRRCQQLGHIKADCETEYCYRCKSFGHFEEDCTAPCLKCKSPDHHWRDCTVRSYAFAVSNESRVPAAAPIEAPATVVATTGTSTEKTITDAMDSNTTGDDSTNTDKQHQQSQSRENSENAISADSANDKHDDSNRPEESPNNNGNSNDNDGNNNSNDDDSGSESNYSSCGGEGAKDAKEDKEQDEEKKEPNTRSRRKRNRAQGSTPDKTTVKAAKTKK